ncbi:alpha/beta hydrolase [Angustibacter peucedani]
MPRRPRPSRLLVAAATAVALLVPAACTGGDADTSSSASTPAPSATSPLKFTGCDQAACEGTLDGAKYQILMPDTWNGTLLLYSHGYRFAQPVPPSFSKPATDAVPAPGADVARTLLDQGYALAGSSYSRNGWAVQEGVAAGQQLYAYFSKTIGTPRRVYLWGDSLGGLVTETLAEQQLPWVSGAAPLCGVLGGTTENLDLALDVAYAVRTLVLPSLQLTGYASHQAAVKQWQAAQRALVRAASSGTAGAAEVALVAALVDAPDQTSTFDGSTPVSKISAAVESALTGLGYGTYGRYEIEQRLKGDPSTNEGVDYSTRVSAAERQLVDAVGGAGTTDRLLAKLAAGRRVAADHAARQGAAGLGEPTGALRVPTLTLHTTKDPLVLVQNERLFADRVRARGQQDRLLQLYVAPPATFTAPAPYGAGHCAFTAEQRVMVIGLLDSWVRTGTRPSGSDVHAATADVKGVQSTYVPSAWPAQTTP